MIEKIISVIISVIIVVLMGAFALFLVLMPILIYSGVVSLVIFFVYHLLKILGVL